MNWYLGKMRKIRTFQITAGYGNQEMKIGFYYWDRLCIGRVLVTINDDLDFISLRLTYSLTSTLVLLFTCPCSHSISRSRAKGESWKNVYAVFQKFVSQVTSENINVHVLTKNKQFYRLTHILWRLNSNFFVWKCWTSPRISASISKKGN